MSHTLNPPASDDADATRALGPGQTAGRGSRPGPAPQAASDDPTADTAAPRPRPDWHRTARLLLASPTFLIGVFIVGFWVVCAFFSGLFVPYDPLRQDLMALLQPPSAAHWFGTDNLGRDVFSRVLAGSADVLFAAPMATLLGTVTGTALGLVAGYYKGWVDEVLSRIIEAFLALPLLVVALLALVALGTSTWTVIGVIGFSFTPIIARTVRSAVMVERELDYVAAARLRRERGGYILFQEILPNVLPPVVVEMTVRLGYAIFAVATLSFLGFGIREPSPDWGLAVANNYGLLSQGKWWLVLWPSIAIATLVVGVNLIADGLSGALSDA